MIDALHPKTPKKCSKSSAFTKPMCYHRSKVCPNHHLKHRGVIHAHDNQTIHLIEPPKRLSMWLRRRRFMPRKNVRNARHRRHSRTSQRLLQHRRRQMSRAAKTAAHPNKPYVHKPSPHVPSPITISAAVKVPLQTPSAIAKPSKSTRVTVVPIPDSDSAKPPQTIRAA